MFGDYNSFYKEVGGEEGKRCFYPTRLDTYGKGCYYDCVYCYSKELLNFRGLWKPNQVGTAPLFNIFDLINNLNKGDVVRLGGMTDCFQPLEKRKHNTYNVIKKLNKKGVHYLIVTKSNLIIDDKYLSILDKNLAHIQISIPTDNDKILSKTDKAPSFNERKETVEVLQENNFDVSLRLSPFLYNTTNFNRINKIKVNKVLVEFLRVRPKIAEKMKGIINIKDYTVKEGGYRHLPLNKKVEILNKLKFKEKSVCDDVKKHYFYFKYKYNTNPNDCCNLRI